MDLDELRSVQSKERRKDSLQHLRGSFYEDVAGYLAERKRQRDERAATVDNPFSDPEIRKLSDEIETAEEVVESLYERRVGKVVKLASFAAAGAPTDTDGMTIQEAELFEDLVVRIEQNKGRVLDVLDNGAGVEMDAPDASPAAPEANAPPAAPDADAPPAAPDADAPAAETDGTAAAKANKRDAPAPSEQTTDSDDTDEASGVLADAMGGPDAGDGGGTERDASASADGPTRNDPSLDDASHTDSVGSPTDGGSETAATGGDHGAEPVDTPDEFVPGSEPDRRGDTGAEEPDPATPAGGTADGDAGAGDRQTVRITRDVGEILGVDDIEYELAAEDVVTLPSENAAPLVQRDAAEQIE